jgi:3-hydroxybutyrate dehydrogenase
MNLSRFAKLFDISGRVAIITGAAQGNGMGIANALHDAGAIAIATDLFFQEDCLLYPEVKRMVMDVSDESMVNRTVDKVIKQYGKVDILINNAGIIYKSPVELIDLASFKKVIDVNLIGTVICTKACVPSMQKNNWGRIVNISSSQAFLRSETYSAYSASKAAISHLTRIWGNELAKFNIIVNALCPSYVMTPMMVNSIKKKAKEMGSDEQGAIDIFVAPIPLKRILEIEEIANWALVLCSELAFSTTGNNFAITGGQVQL